MLSKWNRYDILASNFSLNKCIFIFVLIFFKTYNMSVLLQLFSKSFILFILFWIWVPSLWILNTWAYVCCQSSYLYLFQLQTINLTGWRVIISLVVRVSTRIVNCNCSIANYLSDWTRNSELLLSNEFSQLLFDECFPSDSELSSYIGDD